MVISPRELAEWRLSALPEDTLVPKSFVTSYCGWPLSALGILKPADGKAPRFGTRGPARVSGYKLSDVLTCERTRAFRKLVTHPLSVTKTTLVKDYFFTEKLLTTWVGEPDTLAPNPNRRTGPPMQLYRLGRIALVRENRELAALLGDVADKRDARSSTARAAARKRQEEWISAFRENPVELDTGGVSTCNELARETCRSSGMSWREWSEVDQDTRRRWMVNYLRHERTEYDILLMAHLPPGQAGAACYREIKEKILGLIAEAYPDLADEARRQIPDTGIGFDCGLR